MCRRACRACRFSLQATGAASTDRNQIGGLAIAKSAQRREVPEEQGRACCLGQQQRAEEHVVPAGSLSKQQMQHRPKKTLRSRRCCVEASSTMCRAQLRMFQTPVQFCLHPLVMTILLGRYLDSSRRNIQKDALESAAVDSLTKASKSMHCYFFNLG